MVCAIEAVFRSMTSAVGKGLLYSVGIFFVCSLYKVQKTNVLVLWRGHVYLPDCMYVSSSKLLRGFNLRFVLR
jgi:hypothetical protein